MSKIKIGAQVTAKVRPTKVTVSGTFQGFRLEDQEDPTSICGTVLHVKDGMQHLDYVYVDSIKVCESEDERIYNLIYSSIKNEMPIASPRNKELALAYLERQKEQKSTEWSEEDEEMFDAICAIIRMGVPVESSAKAKIDWLRSFRPQSHWKPSEEPEREY